MAGLNSASRVANAMTKASAGPLRFLLVFVVCCVAHSSYSQEVQRQSGLGPLPVSEVISMLRIVDDPCSLSADGEWLAYTVQDPRRQVLTNDLFASYFSSNGVPTSRLGTDVWLVNTRSKRSRKLTDGKSSNWAPVWSPDGRLLAFFSDRNGTPHVWIYENGSGKVRQVSEEIVHVTRAERVRWSPDSKKVMTKIEVTAGNSGATEQSGAVRTNEQNARVTILRFSRASEPSPTSAPAEMLQDASYRAENGDLGVIDVNTGKVQILTHRVSPVWYAFSPDGSQLAFASFKGKDSRSSSQYLMNLVVVTQGKSERLIAAEIPEP